MCLARIPGGLGFSELRCPAFLSRDVTQWSSRVCGEVVVESARDMNGSKGIAGMASRPGLVGRCANEGWSPMSEMDPEAPGCHAEEPQPQDVLSSYQHWHVYVSKSTAAG
eukprot:scaffold168847_cov13-Prasinocladus_malaysianus.AAC.1